MSFRHAHIHTREFSTYSHLNFARLLVIAKRTIKLCVQRLNSFLLARWFSFALASTHLVSIENYTYFDRMKYRFIDIANLFVFFLFFFYKRVFTLSLPFSLYLGTNNFMCYHMISVSETIFSLYFSRLCLGREPPC